MGYRGMVIINNEDYGEAMEMVSCIKKAACKLAESLSEAQMAERRHQYDDPEMEMPEIDVEYRRGGRSRGGMMRGGGRYGY